MLKKLLLTLSLMSIPSISFSMCNPCTLTAATGSPFAVGFSGQPIDMAISSRCNLLALTATGSGGEQLTVFPVNQNCQLEPPQVIPGEGVNFRSVAFSPDGRCLAAGRANGTITIYAIDENCTLSLSNSYSTTGTGVVTRVTFSSDGSCLAALSRNPDVQLDLFRVDNVNDTCVLVHSSNDTVDTTAEDIAFSPNGNCLVVSERSVSRLLIFPITNCTLGAPTIVTNSNLVAADYVSFSPNGRCLAVGNQQIMGNSGVSIFSVDPEDCTNVTFITQLLNDIPSDTRTRSVQFSPFGNCLAVYDSDKLPNSRIIIFNVDTEFCTFTQNMSIPITNSDEVSPLAFTVDGRCFAIAATNLQDNAIIYTFSTNIVAPPIITQAIPQCDRRVLVTGTTAPGLTVDIFVDGSPTGSTIASGDGTFEITVGPLSLGLHSITAIATDVNKGCSSVPSSPVEIIITDIVNIDSITTTCATVVVTGTTLANTPVTLLIDGVPVGSVVSDINGRFIFVNLPVSDNFHCFVAQVMQNGCIAQSTPVCATITFPNNCAPLNSPNLAFGTHCNV